MAIGKPIAIVLFRAIRLAVATIPHDGSNAGLMGYISTFSFDVRTYEIDVYDHVNNAVYIQWLEHGRGKLLQDHGFDYVNIGDKWGVRFMTVRTEINYRKALKLGDAVTVSTRVERFGNTSVTFKQTIQRNGDGEPAADALVVVVYTDKDSGLPVPVPEQFKRLYG
jgi:YbgC/YbaW family acyl-CoA thioester hydrolase